MDKLLSVWCVLVGLVMLVLTFPEGLGALFLTLMLSSVALGLTSKFAEGKEEKVFLIRIFLGALLVRIIFGLFYQW